MTRSDEEKLKRIADANPYKNGRRAMRQAYADGFAFLLGVCFRLVVLAGVAGGFLFLIRCCS